MWHSQESVSCAGLDTNFYLILINGEWISRLEGEKKKDKPGYSPDLEFCWARLQRFFFEKALVSCFGETST